MKTDEAPTSMVAPSSRGQKTATQGATLQPVAQLAVERGVPAHAIAGMSRANGWAEGKQVTAEEFETAMEAYKNKPMGGKA